MIKLLHLFQELSPGGALRAGLAIAKYSSNIGGYQHRFMRIDPGPPNAAGVELVRQQGFEAVIPIDDAQINAQIEAADIVHFHWWNSPEMNLFLRRPLPAARMIGWFHVGGHVAPQVILPEHIAYFDRAVACSPHTALAPAFMQLAPLERINRTTMIYGPADFERLIGIEPKAHTGFNVGYIGTVDFLKMHPDFVELHSGLNIPGLKVIVCGHGGALQTLQEQIAAQRLEHIFEIRGQVDDIRSVLEICDVYGYPLCPQTYAASELTLQEAMYAGIPPVVFPYGGVRELVIDNFTGLVVRSTAEYRSAIEHLYRDLADRKRISNNARNYAQQIFGAENAAIKFDALYQELVAQPKHQHRFLVVNPIKRNDQLPAEGAALFIESLAGQHPEFERSYLSQSTIDQRSADEAIARMHTLLFTGGVLPYRNRFQDDPFLRYWSGVGYYARGDYMAALAELVDAYNLGLTQWRVALRVVRAAEHLGRADFIEQTKGLIELVPQELRSAVA